MTALSSTRLELDALADQRRLRKRRAVGGALLGFFATAMFAAVMWGLFSLSGLAVTIFAFALIMGSRLVLWWRYRPVALTAAEREVLPTLTVVIPAYNEGAHVQRSIESVLASRYPTERLNVIVVNDGSSDDTGRWIDAAAARNPARVTAIHLPENRGKRHALYAGFKRAQSEYVATVDSDSVVPAGSLANLLAPMLRDVKIAGVAGKVTVENRRANLLTRMLGVRYILGFDLIRAYQSELRTVWCCPGALQAYRRAVIAPHLERWRDQTFLGAACTNGDDHAMTNLVLGLGHDTVYQSNAVVRTLVPETYKRLCKMYIRWGRSATREGVRSLAYAGQRALAAGPLRGGLMLIDAVLQPLGILTRFIGLFGGLALLLTSPISALGGLGATIVIATLYGLIYLRSDRSFEAVFALLYALYAFLLLPWVQPWATLTVRGNRWMTR